MPAHDHFDGSARCVECEGPCRLTGDSRALTEMVRWCLEVRAGRGTAWLNVMEMGTLEAVGADVGKLCQRAMDTARR